MLSVDEALGRLVSAVGVVDSETVSLSDARGRVPSNPEVVATADLPAFANSAMDGYAVRSSDGRGERPVIGESRAGGPPAPSVEPETAVRIMTGAPVPAGADTVVPIEDADERDGRVGFTLTPVPGSHVRAAGLDVRRGQRVSIGSVPLAPSAIGLLAAMGVATIDVRRRPRVAILSTGDELRSPGEHLGHGQVFDANAFGLAAAVEEAGGAANGLERAPDDPDVIESRIRDALAGADLLVASGGVSVGQHDHVRSVIERLGSLDFWRIAVQPGKPLAYGRIGTLPFIGLPGNPVSALVTFEVFVRPMIRGMLGMSADDRIRVRARTDEEIAKDPGRRAYLRVRVETDASGYRATSAGGQGSSQLLPLAAANGLLVVPEGEPATRIGGDYEAILLGAPA